MSEDPRNDQTSPQYGYGQQFGETAGRADSGGQAQAGPDQQLPPAGWYADPHPQGSGQRFWDGAQWTHSTRPDPAAAPGAQEQPGHGQRQPQYGQAQPYGPQQGGHPYQGGYQQNPWRSQAGFARPTGPATADGVRLGGWGARLVAWIIDGILLGVVQAIVLQVFFRDLVAAVVSWQRDVVSAIGAGSANYPSSPADPSYGVTTQWYVYQALAIIIGFVYFVLMMHFRGASLGQQAMGLRVVPAEQGGAPAGLPWSTACIRNVVWYGARLLGVLPLISILAGLFQVVDIVYGLVNKRRQSLHDRIAGTQVVSTRP